MCIRDSHTPSIADMIAHVSQDSLRKNLEAIVGVRHPTANPCLLYTSDAADERSSVDLGGRRIIKKKK